MLTPLSKLSAVLVVFGTVIQDLTEYWELDPELLVLLLVVQAIQLATKKTPTTRYSCTLLPVSCAR